MDALVCQPDLAQAGKRRLLGSVCVLASLIALRVRHALVPRASCASFVRVTRLSTTGWHLPAGAGSNRFTHLLADHPTRLDAFATLKAVTAQDAVSLVMRPLSAFENRGTEFLRSRLATGDAVCDAMGWTLPQTVRSSQPKTVRFLQIFFSAGFLRAAGRPCACARKARAQCG